MEEDPKKNGDKVEKATAEQVESAAPAKSVQQKVTTNDSKPQKEDSEPLVDKKEAPPVADSAKSEASAAANSSQKRAKTVSQPKEVAKKGTNSVTRLLQDAVSKNGTRDNLRLKTHLTGRIQLIVSGVGSYLFDWRGDDMVLTEAQDSSADCTIEMSEADLLAAANGDLNIQIAMLSDKVKLSGQTGMALYLFNIFS